MPVPMSPLEVAIINTLYQSDEALSIPALVATMQIRARYRVIRTVCDQLVADNILILNRRRNVETNSAVPVFQLTPSMREALERQTKATV